MKRDDQDLIGGGLLIALGVFCAIYAQRYGIGTLGRMQAGFLPTALGVILAIIGLFILLPALTRSNRLPTIEWRTAGLVLGSFGVFALTLRPLGLAIASFLTVVVASLADRETTWYLRLLLAVAISIITVVIFRLGLGISIPVWWGG